MRIKKYVIAIGSIIAGYFMYAGCSSALEFSDKRGQGYAGSQSCIKCHSGVQQLFSHNAHGNASWQWNRYNGKLANLDTGMFTYSNGVSVRVEKRNGKLWQVACIADKEILSKPVDAVFGAGSRAMSFAYWEGNQMFQLPLSWFASAHGWANSPGFSTLRENFRRPIITRCMECHGSFTALLPDREQRIYNHVEYLDSNSVIYGIDCERCHGPAADHVRFHQENPGVKTSRFIARWATLSRQQQMDACGVCHSGNDLETQRTTFAFVPGDTLSRFFYPEFIASTGTPDVHGKQVQLLMGSKCYTNTTVLQCTSCHTTHKDETLQTQAMKCITCHNSPEHNSAPFMMISPDSVMNNCINCHMPETASKSIDFAVNGIQEKSPYFLRTHRIAVYPEETQRVISRLRSIKVKQ